MVKNVLYITYTKKTSLNNLKSTKYWKDLNMSTKLEDNRQSALYKAQKLLDTNQIEQAKTVLLTTKGIGLKNNNPPFIHHTQFYLNPNMLKLLTSIGVNINGQDNIGDTILHQLIKSKLSDHNPATWLLDTVRTLEQHGFNLNTVNNLSESALFLLSYNMCFKDENALLYLAEKGLEWRVSFEFNHPHYNFFTNLAKNNHSATLEKILSILNPTIEEINCVNLQKENAAHELATIIQSSAQENILTLMNHGLDITYPNKKGVAALDIIKKTLPSLTTKIINLYPDFLQTKKNNLNGEIKKSQFSTLVWSKLQKEGQLDIWKSGIEHKILSAMKPKNNSTTSSRKI